jgi:lysophospholipase L1-like esterase
MTLFLQDLTDMPRFCRLPSLGFVLGTALVLCSTAVLHRLLPSSSVLAVEKAPSTADTHWVEPMRAVHAKFKGERGIFAHFGDSITDSRAFWTSLRWKRDEAPPQMLSDFELVNTYMQQDCWDRKGGKYGNQGSMTIRWAHQNVATWLKELNPEVALIMFGTNDLNSVPMAEYETKLREVVDACLANGTVVILSTIPPRNKFETKAAQYAEVVRRVAQATEVPLIDYHAEILRRRPDDWNGALDKFAAYQGYEVPTLIARDGVHPSNPKQYSAKYSEEALNSNGFSLRNCLALAKYAEVIRKVLQRP